MKQVANYLLKIGFASLIVVAVYFTSSAVFGAMTTDITTQPAGRFQNFTFFTATTTTATSTNIGVPANGMFRIAGAKKVNMYFSRGGATGANTGSTLFKVQVTPDGTNWYDWNKLSQNVATSTEAWQVGSVSIGAATSTTIVSLDLEKDAFYAVRCIAVETTDGEHSCKGTAEF